MNEHDSERIAGLLEADGLQAADDDAVADVVVLADKADAYNLTYESCTAFNPGSFASSRSFMCYMPARARIDPAESAEAREEYDKRVQYSEIPEEMLADMDMD